MRSTLLSSMMVQNRAEESKQLLGKYQPDLVRDVPQDAVGSPENIEQEDKALENQQKQSIQKKLIAKRNQRNNCTAFRSFAISFMRL